MFKKLDKLGIRFDRRLTSNPKVVLSDHEYPSLEHTAFLTFFKNCLTEIKLNTTKNELNPLFHKKSFDNRPYFLIRVLDVEIVALCDMGLICQLWATVA